MVLDDQLKQATKEHEEKTQYLAENRPTTAKLKQDINLNKRYENQLNKLKVKLNDIRTVNSKLRNEVDVYRKEHKN